MLMVVGGAVAFTPLLAFVHEFAHAGQAEALGFEAEIQGASTVWGGRAPSPREHFRVTVVGYYAEFAIFMIVAAWLWLAKHELLAAVPFGYVHGTVLHAISSSDFALYPGVEWAWLIFTLLQLAVFWVFVTKRLREAARKS
jgi:tetrahydromethanopterin S-methyltransferase subunit H